MAEPETEEAVEVSVQDRIANMLSPDEPGEPEEPETQEFLVSMTKGREIKATPRVMVFSICEVKNKFIGGSKRQSSGHLLSQLWGGVRPPKVPPE